MEIGYDTMRYEKFLELVNAAMERSPERENDTRRNRINRLKQVIVSTVFVLLLLPNILCIAAFICIGGLNRQMDELSDRIDSLTMSVSMNRQYADGNEAAMAALQGEGEDASGATAGEVIVVEQDEMLALQQSNTVAGNMDENAGCRRVCLTFYDGPSANTDVILDILAQYNVKAIFFVTGKPGYEAQYQRIVDEGHTLAMHSYSHKYQEIYSDLESFQEDFFEIQSFLMDVTGVQCKYYRFPGGSSNTVCHVDMRDCIDFLGQQEVVYFDWNVASGDATRDYISVNQIVNNVMGPIENNNWNTYVVLMHDASGKETTVEALPIILERLQAMDDVVIVPITDSVNTVQHVLPEEDTITED